jgi:hypothetical protein
MKNTLVHHHNSTCTVEITLQNFFYTIVSAILFETSSSEFENWASKSYLKSNLFVILFSRFYFYFVF